MQRHTLARTVIVTGSVLGLSAGAWAQDAAMASPSVEAQRTTAPAEPANMEGAEPEVSQVRIVRLSQVRGAVQMDRNAGRGYEAAFANIPVVAGSRIRTGEGIAEVEFEDNSSLRLAPNSEITFGQLGRLASGSTTTAVDVTKGMVYVALEKTKGNQFTVAEGAARMSLAPGAHVRLTTHDPQAELAVFDGAAQLDMGGTSTSLSKKQTVVLSPVSQTVSMVTKGTEEDDWDTWDKREVDYHKQRANLANVGGFGLYGANDLSYYGSFADLPGCGNVWRPYFASAAWDPFASGVWAYYPTGGYSWVSPYPWGWLPYHSGSWQSCGAAGWGWRPGGSWYGVQNQQAMRIAKHPLPHPVAPGGGRNAATLVPVNMKMLNVSGPDQGTGFTFRRDSAGLGVPRTAFGNLHGYAQHVDRVGALTKPMPEGMTTVTPNLNSRTQIQAALQRPGLQTTGASTGQAPGAIVSKASSMHMNSGAFHGNAGTGSAPVSFHSNAGNASSAGFRNSGGGTPARSSYGGAPAGISSMSSGSMGRSSGGGGAASPAAGGAHR